MTILHIPLTKGYVAQIDEDDAHLVSGRRWCASVRSDRVYARSSDDYLHRVITAASKGQYVDHIDGDGLNNCRVNLRITDAKGNCANTRKRGGISRFRGVFWREKKWVVITEVDGVRRTVGHFDSEIEAALAYDRVLLARSGDMAKLNFVDGVVSVPDRLAQDFQRDDISEADIMRFKQWRGNLSQRQMAVAIGVGRRSIMMWELGRTPIPEWVWKREP